MQKIKIVLTSFIAIIMCLGVFTPKGHAAIASPPTGGSLNGAFISSTYGTNQYSMKIEDYYMKPSDGRTFAKKFDYSATSGFKWLTASFIKYAGPYIAIAGYLSDARASYAAKDIRKYTDKNKSVHITIFKDKNGTYYGVEEWNNKISSVKPYSKVNQSYLKVKARYYK